MLSRHHVIALNPGYDCLLDADQRGEVFCADPAVQAFLAGGGLLACGIVPTLRDLTDVPFAALLVRWLVVSCGGDSRAPLKSHTPITATCGLGLLTEGAARRSFQGGPRAGGGRCVHTLPEAPKRVMYLFREAVLVDHETAEAVRILDLSHAAEHLTATGQTVGPQGLLQTPTDQQIAG